ncbi:MAG: FixH family protein [Kofleriaceae bacterium]
MRLSAVVFAFAIAATGSGCGGHEHGDDDSGDESYNCAADDRGEEFVIGLNKPGQDAKLDFTLMAADPAPPMRGKNTWTLQVKAMSGGVPGNPVSGATMLVTPFMPDHGHNAGIPVTIESLTEEGQYKLSPLNLWMPGVWETTIEATADGNTDTVMFTFCLPS